jgi:hypothetical protein
MFVRWSGLVNLQLFALLVLLTALLPIPGMQAATAGPQLHAAIQSMDLHATSTDTHKSEEQAEQSRLVKCCSNSPCSTSQAALPAWSISDVTFPQQINSPNNLKIILPQIASLILKPPRSSRAL